MADATNNMLAEFPDPTHPLQTPDPDAQAQVAARLRQAMNDSTNSTSGERPPQRAYAYLMPTVGTQQGVMKRIGSPELITADETVLLCDVLRVNLDYLRYGGENGYGRFEDSDFIATLYRLLEPGDKERITDLIERLLGTDRLMAARGRRNMQKLAASHAVDPRMYDRERERLARSTGKDTSAVTDEQLAESLAYGKPINI